MAREGRAWLKRNHARVMVFCWETSHSVELRFWLLCAVIDSSGCAFFIALTLENERKEKASISTSDNF